MSHTAVTTPMSTYWGQLDQGSYGNRERTIYTSCFWGLAYFSPVLAQFGYFGENFSGNTLPGDMFLTIFFTKIISNIQAISSSIAFSFN